jgi:hypothetical protein
MEMRNGGGMRGGNKVKVSGGRESSVYGGGGRPLCHTQLGVILDEA